MNLYVSADMEGTAGVATWTQVDPDNASEYPTYRRYMSREVRAAIDGARDAGVKDVLVNDAHWYMRNLLWEELPRDVRMIVGNRKPFSMTEGAHGGFSAAFFTGYHAAIGSQNGVLDHTFTSETLYATRVNGVHCSEALLNAALLGLHGVPVALVTGDRTTVEHVGAHLPWVTGVVVKDGIGRYAANSVSPDLACEMIRRGARTAIERIAEARPFTFAPPIALEIDCAGTHMADLVEMVPGFERIGGRTLRYVHEDYATVFKSYVVAYKIAASANGPT